MEKAASETYRLFHGLNDFLEGNGFRPLEELLLGNSLSGIISESLGKNIASVLRRTERISKSLRSMNSESRRSWPAIFESNLSCKTVSQHRKSLRRSRARSGPLHPRLRLRRARTKSTPRCSRTALCGQSRGSGNSFGRSVRTQEWRRSSHTGRCRSSHRSADAVARSTAWVVE